VAVERLGKAIGRLAARSERCDAKADERRDAQRRELERVPLGQD
jgi:hypothetical protein